MAVSGRWRARLASLVLVLVTIGAAWGALAGLNALLLGLALIGTLGFWVLARTPTTDELRATQLAALLRRWGTLALLSAASVALSLYLPLSLSFPVAFALAALAVGVLLVALRQAGRVM